VAEPLSSGFDGVATRPFEPEQKTTMTAKDKIARRKLSLLELASDLANVSRACKVMGYSRQATSSILRTMDGTQPAAGPEAPVAPPRRVTRTTRPRVGPHLITIVRQCADLPLGPAGGPNRVRPSVAAFQLEYFIDKNSIRELCLRHSVVLLEH
jgi:hypothetical protein